jgi:hypothetical protein
MPSSVKRKIGRMKIQKTVLADSQDLLRDHVREMNSQDVIEFEGP